MQWQEMGWCSSRLKCGARGQGDAANMGGGGRIRRGAEEGGYTVARDGPVLVAFEMRSAWSGRRSRQWREVGGAPWLCPGGRSPGPAVQGDGGGLLANPGPDRVGTHLRVPVTVLLVLVGHSE